MGPQDLARWRMFNLGLTSTPFDGPVDVVRWLGAVQAQDIWMAKWSIAHRCIGVTDTEITRLIDKGQIFRTHLLRPTWHLVLPEDIRLLLQVTGPRVQVANRSMYRNWGLDEATLERSNDLIRNVLQDGNHLTRKEIAEILIENGIDAVSTRLTSIMMNAELEGVVCSGRLIDGQQTYALIEERAPNAHEYAPDEALTEVVRRYFTSHGPATVKDCQRWGSFRIADIRRGIAMLGSELGSIEIDGLTYWYAHDKPAKHPASPDVHLLQSYDEYVMGYSESRGLFDIAGRLNSLNPDAMRYSGMILIDSQVAGHWRRTRDGTMLALEIHLYETVGDVEIEEIQQVANRLGEFLELDFSLEYLSLTD